METENPPPLIACTPGDPAGIGPDLLLLLASQQDLSGLVVVASFQVMTDRAAVLGKDIELLKWPQRSAGVGSLSILDVACPVEVEAGIADPTYAPYLLKTLDVAIEGCLEGRFSAMVTGPINKGLICDAGIPFSGHTEYLAERTSTAFPVMMLATTGLRVALVTTHLPLREVSDAISMEIVEQVLRTVDRDLTGKMGIVNPRILVCGLNPHAGEGGHMGREDVDTIQPVIERLASEGLNVSGPHPADTVFTDHVLATADVVVAMYHDQGLPVLKYKGFGDAVNITLGLPITRTSVDHGTAYDLAGSGDVNTGSLNAAIDAAVAMTLR